MAPHSVKGRDPCISWRGPDSGPMPVLLDAHDLHKAFSAKVLLDEVSLAITDTMKLGLVGVNGAGKSTLLRILLGDEEADNGTVHRSNDLRLGHLPQHDPFQEGETVAAFLERWSGCEPWTCAALAARFGIDEGVLASPALTCSGGWRTRAKLCAVLLCEPNLLVLDEPTNFLDLRTQLLLEDFLAGWSGAALVVSHDRRFLQQVTTHTAELSNGSLRLAPSPIEDAIIAWREDEERLARRAANLESKARQLQRFVDANRAKASTASQARSKAKQVARLQEEIPDLPSITSPRAHVRVPPVERRDGPACHITDLAVGYAGKAIAQCPHLEIQRGERLAVMGDNGQGKTTFLRTLVGDLPTVAGSLRWTHGAEVAVYAQHVYLSLGDTGTVLDHLSRMAGPTVRSQEVLDVAGSFLFRGDEVHKPLSVCSGGERARAVLAGILLTGATVLVLDEPTNHLDVATVESLGEALTRYGGTVILASHDARFVEQVCTGIIEVGEGRIQRWPGEAADYCQDLRQHLAQTPSPRPAATPAAAAKTSAQAGPGFAQRQRAARKRVQTAERQLERLRRRLTELEAAQLQAADTSAAQALAAELLQQQTALDRAEEEWLEAQEELESAN
ncbi:MAG: ABC transporter ATP-binding protein [Planctomycetota bacterium]|nr:MAG: ABC transporter ATP-binding protein [Planctomycetota bacterium]